ncbi:MAG: hypothetical protein Q4D95_05725 [Peptoniphilus sp.]|nr:hypothetical protein [Peptoniphilus sp.]
MKITVCLKNVPVSNKIVVDKKKNSLVRSKIEQKINPCDLSALTIVVKIKELLKDVFIEIVSMDAGMDLQNFYEAIALGADKVTILSDRAFAGSDAWATSNVLGKYLSTNDSDFIFVGMESEDGHTRQIGPRLSAKLDRNFVSNVCDAEMKEDELILKKIEENQDIVSFVPEKSQVFGILSTEVDSFISLENIVDAIDASPIEIINNSVLNCEAERIGLNNSKTKVTKIYREKKKNEVSYINPDYESINTFVRDKIFKEVLNEG